MKKYKVVAIVGEAGSGKDRVLQEILKRNKKLFHEIIHHTTRPPRDNETKGKDYFFVTEELFAAAVCEHQMIEFAEYRDWYYGTSKGALSEDRINIGTFNLKAIKQLQENQDIDLLIFKISATPKTRLLRQLNREDCPDCAEIVRRYGADKTEFANFKFTNYHTFMNEDKHDLRIIRKYLPLLVKFWAKVVNSL